MHACHRTPQLLQSTVSDATIDAERKRVLPLLCNPGAVLAIAAGMERAIVVYRRTGREARLVLGREIAEAFALKGWIVCDNPGQVSKYFVTRAGRETLAQDRVGNGPDPGNGKASMTPFRPAAPARRKPWRGGVNDTPLHFLARHKGRNGDAFLTPDLIRAGERLQEDYELARTRRSDLAPYLQDAVEALPGEAHCMAKADPVNARLFAALQALGPGLGDVALLCCCQREGLEAIERKLGWSARSAKIVLRIALQHLKRHYDDLGEAAAMIG